MNESNNKEVTINQDPEYHGYITVRVCKDHTIGEIYYKIDNGNEVSSSTDVMFRVPYGSEYSIKATTNIGYTNPHITGTTGTTGDVSDYKKFTVGKYILNKLKPYELVSSPKDTEIKDRTITIPSGSIGDVVVKANWQKDGDLDDKIYHLTADKREIKLEFDITKDSGTEVATAYYAFLSEG